jgi:hypothetical protein
MNSKPQRTVVSRRVIIKGERVGEVRHRDHPGVAYDEATARDVIETPTERRYVKQVIPPLDSNKQGLHVRTLPLMPTAPLPVDVIETPPPSPRPEPEIKTPAHRQLRNVISPSDPDAPRTHTVDTCSLSDIVLVAGVSLSIAIIVAACFAIVYEWRRALLAPPVERQLLTAAWAFDAVVHEWRVAVKEGWDLPPDHGKIHGQELRHRGMRQVLDHYQEVCTLVLRTERVLSHYDPECKEERTGWQEEREVYSHTEEVCYNDGSCDEEEVYTRVRDPIIEVVCRNTKPVYQEHIHHDNVCKQHPVMRQEPQMSMWYIYDYGQWWSTVGILPVHYEGEEEPLIPPLPEGKQYAAQQWSFTLTISPNTTFAVSRDDYLAYKGKIGQTILVREYGGSYVLVG